MSSKEKSFLDWLYERNQILTQENVIFAKDAFFTNSAMRWIIVNEKQGRLSKEEAAMYASALQSHIEKELDLCWHDGKICMKLNNGEEVPYVGNGLDNSNTKLKKDTISSE